MRVLLTTTLSLLVPLTATAQWSQETKLVPGDLGSGDGFGAAVSVSGDTTLVGASLHDGVGTDEGAAYVYVRAGAGWVQQAKLRALDGGAGDRFGRSVSLDGDTALVSAPYHAGPKGAVYVFQRSGTTWVQQAKLMLTVPDPGRFGLQLALDGDTAAISAYQSNQYGEYVYVYVRSGTAWGLQDVISGGGFYDDFACDLDLDGDRLVVGEREHDGVFEDNVGAAHVYERVGSSWSYQAELLGPVIQNFRFGTHVAISGDTILVAADPLKTTTFVYVGSGATWTLQQTLGFRAHTLALDGNLALVGDDSWSTSLYLVRVWWRSGTTWSHQHSLGAYGLTGASDVDGGTVVIGNPDDDDAGSDAGAAFPLSFEPGSGFCFGDPGSGTPCPCNNDNDGSAPGSGCDNGVFASGAKLAARGIASVSHDSLVLYTERAEPDNSGLYFQANNAVNGGVGIPFGDGLRCAGGQLQRLQVRFSDASGYSATTVAVAAKGGVAAGETRRYQCWYRNQSTPACGLGVNEFNLSNGYEVVWGP